jgi:hypothetical protein
VSTGRSIHAVPSITPSPREGIEDRPRLRQRVTRQGQKASQRASLWLPSARKNAGAADRRRNDEPPVGAFSGKAVVARPRRLRLRCCAG